jgi:hypothetical protein
VFDEYPLKMLVDINGLVNNDAKKEYIQSSWDNEVDFVIFYETSKNSSFLR